MKKYFTIAIISIAGMALFPAIGRAEIPQKVTVQKINIYGSYDQWGPNSPENLHVEIANGRVKEEGEMREGQWQIDVSGIDYNLDFWNVGEEGGKSGMLFWKKDYGLATLTFTYNFADAGRIVKKKGELEGFEAFGFEDASREPDVQVVYHFKFSGGPSGTFEEIAPYVAKTAPATGRIINGKMVSFDFPFNEQEKYPYGLVTSWMNFPWEISGDPFYGYETGGGPCGFDPISSNNQLNHLAFVPKAEAKDSGARFTAFSGEVTVAPEDDPEDEVPAELDMVLAEGDRIETQIESCAIIGFSDMTTFLMNPLTSIILEHSPPRESHLSLLTGKIWANVKKMVKNGTMDVKMNQAVAGIKGTTFILEETGEKSIIKVIDGKVEFTSLSDDSKVMVGSGEMVAATNAGLSKKTSFDVEAESQVAQQTKDTLTSSPKTTNSAPSSKKRSSTPIIAVAVVVILLFGAYFFFRSKKKAAKL